MVRTRIAPSPTGNPHIGTIYQSLFDYVFAKKYGGKFILRIEDTDRVRLTEGAEDAVIDALNWFDLQPNEGPLQEGKYGPYRQSERKEKGIYAKYMFEEEGLVNKFLPTDILPGDKREKNNQNHYCAYYCFCTKERLDELRQRQQANKQVPRYDKFCLTISRDKAIERSKSESFVIRLNVPQDYSIIFDDWLVGKVTISSKEVDDQVLIKSDGYPTYHFAVVIDDHEMEISHVFRGKEWLVSTPKHIILYEYFNWSRPIYIHLPVILNSDGKGKLSKRHGHSSVNYYREEGYLPQAILNYLANIVWNHPQGEEIFTMDEFANHLHLHNINDAVITYANVNEGIRTILSVQKEEENGFKKFVTSQAPRFDLNKLTWMNGMYIREKLSPEELLDHIMQYEKKYGEKVKQFEELGREKLLKIVSLAQLRIETLKQFYPLAKHFLPGSEIVLSSDSDKEVARSLQSEFEHMQEWNKDSILEALRSILKKHSIRMPVLYTIITGQERGLPLPESLEILGKEEILLRLQKAL